MASGRRVLAGVANVDIFRGRDLIATATTLLDSSITVGVTAEEVRGGQGFQLFTKYYHTSTFGINLTDTMFKLEYIAFQTGSKISRGGNIYTDEQVVLGVDGKGKILGNPVNVETFGTIGWAHLPGSEDHQTVEFENGEFTYEGGTEGQIVCVKYLDRKDAAKVITVSSNFIPDTVHLVMHANLFDGGGSNGDGSQMTKVGSITVDVPRFQFDGNQEISMSASGVANTPLAGSALANIAADCGQTGYYATIVEDIIGAVWYDGVKEIVATDADFNLGIDAKATLSIRAITTNGMTFMVNNDNLTFTSDDDTKATVDENGIVTGIGEGAVEINIVAKEQPKLTTTVNIDVTQNP